MNNDDMYIKTYIAKFEQAFLEHVRKQVDLETRLAIYEAAIQDLQRKLEESERIASDNKLGFEQAIVGLEAVTLERDELKNIKDEKERVENENVVLKHKLYEAEQRLESLAMDNTTLKNNYAAVLHELEKPVITSKDSEWIDGDEISS